MNVALTGATGFLGHHVALELLKRGETVISLEREGSHHPALKDVESKLQREAIEWNSQESLSRALEGVEAVIHMAGLVSYRRADEKLMRDTHVELTRKVLVAAEQAGVRRFVHVSSIVTVGRSHRGAPVDERAPYDSRGLRLAYWDTKAETEELALGRNRPGFEVVSLNPGTLLGSGEKHGQFGPFLKKLASASRPWLPAGGSDFVDVRDVAWTCAEALRRGRPGERYILGSENLSYPELYARASKLMRKDGRSRTVQRAILTFVAATLDLLEELTGWEPSFNAARIRRVNGVKMYHDCSKAVRELGYHPRAIDDALAVMLKENGVDL